MTKKSLLIILVLILLVLVGLWFWRAAKEDGSDSNTLNITNFEQCAAAGYPIGESFPRQCFGPNGQSFVESVEDSVDNDQSQQIKIHFSKDPESKEDFDFTVAVNRDLSNVSNKVETGLVELIKGPTASEANDGLFSPIKLSGESNCDGGNFKYTTSGNKFTFSFCKQVTSAGVGDDARIKSVIEATIAANAAPSTYDIIILDRSGDCFGDQSGQNQCLN